jgi:hypothetical protein
MMEAARTSETLVNFYQTTRCYNPEDSHLHTHRRENLKSYLDYYYCNSFDKHLLLTKRGLTFSNKKNTDISGLSPILIYHGHRLR